MAIGAERTEPHNHNLPTNPVVSSNRRLISSSLVFLLRRRRYKSHKFSLMVTESSPVSSPSSPIPAHVSDPQITAIDSTHQSSSPNIPLSNVKKTTTTTAVRKFRCWTKEETTELIKAYRDMWYSIHCRNLPAAGWEAVASLVNSRCPPSATPSSTNTESVTTATESAKTSGQCQCKIETLRRQYRAEKQRALNNPNRFFASSWKFFDLMDEMEKGACVNGGFGPNLGNSNSTGDAAAASDALWKFAATSWTKEETMELINVYKDKWYSIHCRNLSAADWEAVAADLNTRLPTSVTPSSTNAESVTTTAGGVKTSWQCRNKMEKLRKRYRAEKLHVLNNPDRVFTSSWIYFDQMDAMETGSCHHGGSGPNFFGNLKSCVAASALGAAQVVKKKKKKKKKKMVVEEEDDNGGLDLLDQIKFKFKSHGSSLEYDDVARLDRHLEAEEKNYASGYDSGRVLSGKAVSGSFDRNLGGKSSTFGGGSEDDDDTETDIDTDDDVGDFYNPRFNSRAPNGRFGLGKRSRGWSKRSRAEDATGSGMLMESDHHHHSTPANKSDVTPSVTQYMREDDGFRCGGGKEEGSKPVQVKNCVPEILAFLAGKSRKDNKVIDEDLDSLKAAKKRGMEFPRPRWW